MINGLMIFLTSGAMNPYYGYLLCALAIFLGVQIIRRGNVYLNFLRAPGVWALLLWGVTYMVIGTGELSSLLRHIAVPVLSFAAGWIIFEDSEEEKESVLRKLILSMVAGFCLHAALNYFTNVGHTRYEIVDFFSGKVITATGAGCTNTMGICLLGYWLLIEKKLWKKLLGLSATVPFLLYLLQLGTRTTFIILAVVFLMVLVFYCGEMKKGRVALKIIFGAAIFAAAAYFIYDNNLWGIADLIDHSELVAHFRSHSKAQQAADRYRFRSVLDGLNSLLEHPFGGQIERLYFHNLWLDVGRVGGVIPFAFMMGFTVINIAHLLSLFFGKNMGVQTRYMIAAVETGILINFLVEPVIEGIPELWFPFCILAGYIEALCYYEKHKLRLPRLAGKIRLVVKCR